jgi:LacI family transcriptional regulator
MADIARKAGVSVMTVSKVVNNKDDISQATRERVQTIIEKTGYRPSHIARGLATNRTGTLGVVVPDNANPFFSEITRAAEHLAYAEGYNIFLCNTSEDAERELTVLRSLEEKRVDGIILCSSRLDDAELRAALTGHPHTVLVNRRLDDHNSATVMVDDIAGGAATMRHVLQAGHQVIGMLAGPEFSFSGSQRLKGHRTVLEDGRYPLEWMAHCSPTVQGGYEVGGRLLTQQPNISALLCFNDLVAVGAILACKELNLAVPQDVAVAGYDDIPLAALVTPSLTTCHVPLDETGHEAMRLLLHQIKDEQTAGEISIIQPQLVIRKSAP